MKFNLSNEVLNNMSDIDTLLEDKLFKYDGEYIKLKKSDITWLGGGYGIWDKCNNYLIIYDDYIIDVHMYSYDLVYRMMEDFDMLIVSEDSHISVYRDGEIV